MILKAKKYNLGMIRTLYNIIVYKNNNLKYKNFNKRKRNHLRK